MEWVAEALTLAVLIPVSILHSLEWRETGRLNLELALVQLALAAAVVLLTVSLAATHPVLSLVMPVGAMLYPVVKVAVTTLRRGSNPVSGADNVNE